MAPCFLELCLSNYGIETETFTTCMHMCCSCLHCSRLQCLRHNCSRFNYLHHHCLPNHYSCSSLHYSHRCYSSWRLHCSHILLLCVHLTPIRFPPPSIITIKVTCAVRGQSFPVFKSGLFAREQSNNLYYHCISINYLLCTQLCEFEIISVVTYKDKVGK